MKKILVILLVLLVTGCGTKQNFNFVINDDKSIDISMLVSYDNEFIDAFLNEKNNTDKTYSDDERWKALEEELGISELESYYTYEKFEEGDYKGFKFITKIDNIENVTGDDANFEIADTYSILDFKIFKKEENTYIANFKYSGINIRDDFENDTKFIVTLPVVPNSSNATSISEDKKTLTWNLVTPDDGEIKFSFDFENEKTVVEEKNNNILLIGVGVAVVAVIVAVVIVLKFRKKEEF